MLHCYYTISVYSFIDTSENRNIIHVCKSHTRLLNYFRHKSWNLGNVYKREYYNEVV